MLLIRDEGQSDASEWEDFRIQIILWWKTVLREEEDDGGEERIYNDSSICLFWI